MYTNDFQKRLQDINWVRPYLLIIGDFSPLFNILWGYSFPNSKCSLSPEVDEDLKLVYQTISLI